MPKIEKFTISEFLEKESEYLDMVEMIELRALEIAKDLGKIESPYVVDHVDIGEESSNIQAHAVFYNMLNPDDVKDFGFNAEWLFNDEHLKRLPPEDFRKRRFGKEFEEYMRLKAKNN